MTVIEHVRLGDCCDIVSGATPSTAEKKYWEGDILWATPKDLSDLKYKYISDTPQKLTKAGYASCSAKILPEQSVLFSSRAPIGHVAINTVPMCTNQGFKSFVPDRDRLSADYLYYWLKANKAYLQSLGNGATFKEVSKSTIAEVKVPLPSLHEQRRIAAILDKADALRAKRREAIAKLDQLLHSVFIEMFGDPATNPKGWPLVCLGDAIEFSTGKLDSNAAEENGAYPFFTCSRTPSRINTYAFDCEALLLAGNNAAGQYWVKHYSGKFNAYQRTYVLTLKNEHCTYLYMKQALQARLLDLQRMSKGSNTKYLTLSILKPMLIPLAPIEIQRSYCAFYVKLQQLLTDQYRSLEHLDALFRAAQDQVFSGTL
ncbi:restriction endonuclease subunit S [Pseudomonas sp. URMO17WK12:I4]|uniref:restriction endonuclease subunit S n=1 Tax=Pseudomonas sp. URMO17WK12:I4 TaxID=1283292 RepID=UPI0009E07CEF|nr:restriction endonuclease subunit S [Pseudomonas sp. URMO17WK12:I4]